MYRSIYLPHDERPEQPFFRQSNRRPWQILKWILIAAASLMAILHAILLVLRWLPPPTSAFMLQSEVPESDLRYHWVPWRRICPYLPVAVIASEDQKFPHHWGFDLDAISKAVEENKWRRRPRGASTITQQVAKNLFLWSGRSYLRKGLEAYFTMVLELVWSKRRILEVYLNIAQFGPSIYGAEAASRAYFDKSASRLSKSEAALLASVLPNPRKLKAANPSEYVRQRAREIEAQMEQLGGSVYLKDL
jgi:monofunctional biosynthetic peptidoglycan transglycosylase